MSASGFRVVLRSLCYPQKFRGHEESWVCAQAHVSPPRFFLNTGRLCSAGSGCRAPFPTIVARLQPSDSPCRFSTPPVFPRSCLTTSCKRWFCAWWRHRHGAGRRSVCCRRRVGVGLRFSVARFLRLDGQGSPRLPGRLLRPCHSRPPRRSPFGSPIAPPGMLLSWLLSP